jgi:DNA-binding MarR family transcriptional regulator
MASNAEIGILLEAYPRIYFACHMRHVRDKQNGQEVSAHQASILDHLDTKQGTSVLEIARHLGVTASTMSLSLDRLERANYIRRERDSIDRRRTLIHLTTAGERIKRQAKVLEPELVGALLDRLPAPQRKQALAGLQLLAEAANQLIGSPQFSELLGR